MLARDPKVTAKTVKQVKPGKPGKPAKPAKPAGVAKVAKPAKLASPARAPAAAPKAASSKRTESFVEIDGRQLKLSNPQKVLWPEDGYTKGELVAYYRSVAPFLLPYLAQRPLTLQRWPDGIHGFSFFEKNIPRGAPEWVPTYEVPSTGKRATVAYVLCNDESTLVWLANLGSITMHVWMSRIEAIDNPDYVLFDLDPWEGCTLKTLANVALTVRDVLESIGLTPLVKSSGGSGLHVVLPVKPVYDYEILKAFGELVARRVASMCPKEVTLERMTKKRPAGTVYFDWVQIGKGKTIVPPFVVRARAGAPVSMPLSWDEVDKMSRKRSPETAPELVRWNIGNVPALLAKGGDPWAELAQGSHLLLEPALEEAQATWPRDDFNVDDANAEGNH